MRLLFSLVFISLLLNSCIKKTDGSMSTMPDEKSRNELLSKLQEFSEAWAKSDTSLLDKLLASEYKHTDIHGKIFNRKQWLEDASAPKIIVDIKMDSIETLWFGTIAVVTGRISFKSGEQKQNVEMRCTQIWTSQEGSWKRAVFQGTLDAKNYLF